MTSCLTTEKSQSLCEMQLLPVSCLQRKLLYIYVFKAVFMLHVDESLIVLNIY